MHQVTVH